MRAAPVYDCQRCGSCCSDPSCADGAIVLLSEQEESLIPARYRRRLVVVHGFPPDPGMTADATGRCAALVGEIGKRVACAVYPVRPSICGKFEPGGLGCLYARKEAGLA